MNSNETKHSYVFSMVIKSSFHSGKYQLTLSLIGWVKLQGDKNQFPRL